MYVYEFSGLKLFVASVHADDPKKLIKYSEEGFIEPLKRGSIATPRHGFYIAYKSRLLRNRRIKLPNSVALCLVAGTTQISDALKIVGASPGLVQVIGVGDRELEEIDKRPSEEEIRQIHGTSDERALFEKAAITALNLY